MLFRAMMNVVSFYKANTAIVRQTFLDLSFTVDRTLLTSKWVLSPGMSLQTSWRNAVLQQHPGAASDPVEEDLSDAVGSAAETTSTKPSTDSNLSSSCQTL